MEKLIALYQKLILDTTIPRIGWTDLVEVIIIAILIYSILVWLKDTRGWTLIKGLIVIFVFIIIAYVLQMNTILWLARNASVVAITAMIVVFQPELRQALDALGRRNVLMKFLGAGQQAGVSEQFSDRTINEIVKAAYEMGKVKTGALIVITRQDALEEFLLTGIEIDGIVTSQLLINIFEKNTPLHDGAVVVSGNRVMAATCYLPLTGSNDISKDLGTRHRAAIGISEVSDSITVTVSEETGKVSIAINGRLFRNVDAETAKRKLELAKPADNEEKKFLFLKRKKTDKA